MSSWVGDEQILFEILLLYIFSLVQCILHKYIHVDQGL